MAGISEFEYHNAYQEVANGISSAVENISNKKMNPTEAVIKAAQDNNLNVQKATRVGETINISLSLSHFKKNAASDRGENFPMVDVKAVASVLSGPDALTRSNPKNLLIARMEKDAEINRYLNRNKNDVLVKLATDAFVSSGLFQEYLDGEKQVEKSESAIKLEQMHKEAEAERQIEELFIEHQHSLIKAGEAFNSIVRQFSTTNPPDPVEFIKYAMSKYQEAPAATVSIVSKIQQASSNFDADISSITKESMQVNFVDEGVANNFDILYSKTLNAARCEVEIEKIAESIGVKKKTMKKK